MPTFYRHATAALGLALILAAAAAAAPPLDAPDLAQPAAGEACQPASFKIALDVGHYRARPGAISANGVTEFTYNLALARALLAALHRDGFGAAFLIGEGGGPISLGERTRIAAQAGAELLISLHHDSVQPRYLSTWSVAGRPQHYSDLFHGYSIFVSGKNRKKGESEKFATLLGRALLDKGLTPSLHHAENIPGENRPLLDPRLGIYRFDDLVVLKTAPAPAVLLESGIIVNRSEEQQIRSGTYEPRVVAALLDAVRQYCGALHPKTAAPRGQ